MTTKTIILEKNWFTDKDILEEIVESISEPKLVGEYWEYQIKFKDNVILPTCGQQYEKQNNEDELKSSGIDIQTPLLPTTKLDYEDLP